MTISVPGQLVYSSQGDGVTTEFTYPVRFEEASELVVISREDGVDTVLTLNTDYTVAGAGVAGGGTVTMLYTPAATEEIVRYRDTAAKQIVNLADSTRNPAEAVENQLDRFAMNAQDQSERLSRAVLARPGSIGQTLPEPEADKIIMWNTDGDGLVNRTIAEQGELVVGVNVGDMKSSEYDPDAKAANAFDSANHDVTYPDIPSLEAISVQEALAARTYNAALWGVKSATTDQERTDRLQQAIDDVSAAGGGILQIPKKATPYTLAASSATDTCKFIVDTTTTLDQPISDFACIALRTGVYLDLGFGAVLKGVDTTKTVVAFVDCESGGIFNGKIFGSYVVGGPGGGHGILTAVSDFDKPNAGLILDNLEIGHVGGYGFGYQYGYADRNRYSRLFIHDTGADGIDHKVRFRAGTTEIDSPSEAVEFWAIKVLRPSRRVDGSACIDIRGPANLNGIVCLDFAHPIHQTAGVRFSAPSRNDVERRQSGGRSTLDQYRIESGDMTNDNAEGIAILDSADVTIGIGTVKDCRKRACSITDAASSSSEKTSGVKVLGLTADGCLNEGIFVAEAAEGAIITGCAVKGSREAFRSELDNITEGQTVFVTERGMLGQKIYKNDVLLTETTDYTKDSTYQFTLVVGATVTDVIEVVCEAAVAYKIDAPKATLVGNNTEDVQIDVSTGAASTIVRMGNNFDGAARMSFIEETQTVAFNGTGAGDVEAARDGTGGYVWKSNGRRVFRALGEANAVNWLQIQSCADGDPLRIVAVGSSANIDVYPLPKGTGRLRVGPYTADAVDAPSTGYIEIKDVAGVVRKVLTRD